MCVQEHPTLWGISRRDLSDFNLLRERAQQQKAPRLIPQEVLGV